MPDICMCRGVNCPLKEDCYRYTREPNPYRQAYFDVIPAKIEVSVSSQRIFADCEYFLSNRENK